MTEKKKPNLFYFATSELSQDAFILWLLDWANPQYQKENQELNNAAQSFVRLLLGNNDLNISNVDCYKQENHIDVFAIVNNRYALIIEDKTDTSEHSNQLKRYTEWVEKTHSELELRCVYYKTGNESLYKNRVLQEKYSKEFPGTTLRIVTRKNVIECLSSYDTKDSIFVDYLSHLIEIESSTRSYSKLQYPTSWRAWQGFYMELEKKLGEGDWGYVANPNGGFLGFWWNWVSVPNHEGIQLYLQFEQNRDGMPRLCIKAYNKPASRTPLQWTNIIIKIAREHGLILSRPSRRRIGETMTLAVVEKEQVFREGTMDIEKTCSILRNLGGILHEIAARLS